MMRTATIRGKYPCLIAVPHGFDDPNTSVVGESMINELNCYGIINYGWKRADIFDYYKDHANCNNIEHLSEDVVKEEFLEPFIKYNNEIGLINGGYSPVFIIHGVSNEIKKITKPHADLILGIGQGNPQDSLSCSTMYSDIIYDRFTDLGLATYFGKAGGKYSGFSKKNLNQYVKNQNSTLISLNCNLQSIQIEIIKDLRETKEIAQLTGSILARAIAQCLYDFKMIIFGNSPKYLRKNTKLEI